MDHHVSQDLSIAGTRKGLAGDRSGLFKEQIRIIKEMRKQYADTHGANEPVRPRYCIWENVKGCLSSPGKNRKGEDFRAVLTEFVRVVCEGAPDVPMPEKRQWKHAGVLYGVGDDGRPFSVAWRLHDAQYHGVPQRRARMCVLCDYGGYSAGEILFDLHDGGSAEEDYKDLFEGRSGAVEREDAEVSDQCEGLLGNHESGEAQRKETAGNSGAGVDTAISFVERGGKEGGGKGILISKEHTGAVASYTTRVCYCFQGNVIDRSETAGANGKGWTENVAFTLNSVDRHAVCAGFSFGQSAKAGSIGFEEEISPCLRGGEGGNQKPCVVYDARGNGDGETAPKITGDHNNRVTDYTALCVGNGQMCNMSMAPIANGLDCMHDQQAILCYQNTGRDWWKGSDIGATLRTPAGGDATKDNLCVNVAAVDCRNGTENPNTNGTLQAKENGGTSINYQNVCRWGTIVRRLIPDECASLQGYPRNWCNIGEWIDSKGKKHKDSDTVKYKAFGNSIALPFWQWLACRISELYDRPVEIASLFDGIGGFPLVFERAGGRAVWASEIEEFPIAVTMVRFPDE